MALKKTEVIKHSASIHITNRVNLLQRRTWNILLAQAFDDLPYEEEYQVQMKDLFDELRITTRNEKHFKQLLKALATTAIEWNVLDKDGDEEWGVTSLLAQAKIKKGIVTYAYSPELRRRLYNPKMYAKISLSIQNDFDSKHALAIYELCRDYFDDRRLTGETPYISLDRFRKLMGIEKGEYEDFRRLNTRVIKGPVLEINKKSDLSVTVVLKREKRKVIAIKFRIYPNKKNPPVLPSGKNGLLNTPLAKRLKLVIGYTNTQLVRILSDYTDEKYIQENLDVVENRIQRGMKIDDLQAYFNKALKEDWRRPKNQMELKLEKIEKQRKEKEDKIKKEKQKKERELKQKLDKYDNIYLGLSNKQKETITARVEERLKKESVFVYERYLEGKEKGLSLDQMPLVKASYTEYRNEILEKEFKNKV